MVWSLFNADDRDCGNDKYDGDDGNDEKRVWQTHKYYIFTNIIVEFLSEVNIDFDLPS